MSINNQIKTKGKVIADGRPSYIQEIPLSGTYLIIYAQGWDNPHTKGHDQGEAFKKNAEALRTKLIMNGINKSSIVLLKATTEEEFLNAVNRIYPTGKIKQLDVYSHMSNNGINFGGNTNDEAVNATPAEKDYRILSYWSGENNNYNPDGDNELLKIDKDNFDKDAIITLWGCNAGYFFDDENKRIYALGQGFANHIGVTTRAFDSYSEFKTKNGDGKSIVFDGEMIRTKDRRTQEVKLNVFKKNIE